MRAYFAVIADDGDLTVVSRGDRLHAALWLSEQEAEWHRDRMQSLNPRYSYRTARVVIAEQGAP